MDYFDTSNEVTMNFFEALSMVPMCKGEDFSQLADLFLRGMYMHNGTNKDGSAKSADEVDGEPSIVGIFCDRMYRFFYSMQIHSNR